MSVAQEQRSERVEVAERRGVAPPVWWLVFRREFIDLWTGGRVLLLLILFSLVMSVTSALRELESSLSLIPPVEMAFLTILSGISFGLFVGMVIGADSISGERERATLEPLLLTPAKPRQIVFGKFLAAMSPWPVTFLLTIPYVVVLAHGDNVVQEGLLLGALLGGLLAIAFTGFGMLAQHLGQVEPGEPLCEPGRLPGLPHPDPVAGKRPEGRPGLPDPAVQPPPGLERVPGEGARQQPDRRGEDALHAGRDLRRRGRGGRALPVCRASAPPGPGRLTVQAPETGAGGERPSRRRRHGGPGGDAGNAGTGGGPQLPSMGCRSRSTWDTRRSVRATRSSSPRS